MTNYHAWKGRISSRTGRYPVENGPPLKDSAGQPIWPLGAGSKGPRNGVGDTWAAWPGPTPTITFTGPATKAMAGYIFLQYLNPALVQTQEGGAFTIANGATAAQIATACAAAINAEFPAAHLTAAAVGAVVTITCTGPGQTVNGHEILYVETATGALLAEEDIFADDPGPDDDDPELLTKAKKKK